MKTQTTLLVMALLGASAGYAQETAHNQCTSRALGDSMSWLTSAVYVPALGKLVAVDATKSQLLVIDTDSTTASTPLDVASGGISDARPVRLASYQDGFLLKLNDSRALLLTEELGQRANGVQNFSVTSNGAPNGLGAVYEWIPFQGRVFGIGTVRNAPASATQAPPKFQTGFFVGNLGTAVSDVQLLQPPFGETSYYLRGLTTMAATTSGVYGLQLGRLPEVFAVDFGPPARLRRLAGMPDGFETLPELPKSTGPASTPRVFAALRSQKAPAGLYATETMLLLLTREPDASNRSQTRWLIHLLDPATGDYRGVVRLPTTAPHLTIARSPDSYFVFEKENVKAWGDQPVTRLLRIPKGWIEQVDTSPLAGESPEVKACSASK